MIPDRREHRDSGTDRGMQTPGTIGPPARGFTLIEMMAVILLVGLGVSVTTMSLDNATPHHRLHSQARKVGSLIKRARMQSIKNGQYHILLYDTENNRIRLLESDPESFLTPGEEIVDPEDVEEQNYMIEETFPPYIDIARIRMDESLNSGQNVIRIPISPQGYIQPHIIHMTGEEDLQYSVIPNAISGRVQYSSGHVEGTQFQQDDRSSLLD